MDSVGVEEMVALWVGAQGRGFKEIPKEGILG